MIVVVIIAVCISFLNLIVKIPANIIQYMNNLDLNNPQDFKTAVSIVYGDPVEIYEDALLICFEEYVPEGKALIYDFSLWDSKKIIGLTSRHQNVKYNEDGKPRVGIIPKQKVFRYKDGTILWSPQLQ